MLDSIRRAAAAGSTVASVCTGAFPLALAGLRDGRTATTHWEDQADLRERFPAVAVVDDVRWVDHGSVATSAGVSADIDLALHLVARLAGDDLAVATARQMDYPWTAEVVRPTPTTVTSSASGGASVPSTASTRA